MNQENYNQNTNQNTTNTQPTVAVNNQNQTTNTPTTVFNQSNYSSYLSENQYDDNETSTIDASKKSVWAGIAIKNSPTLIVIGIIFLIVGSLSSFNSTLVSIVSYTCIISGIALTIYGIVTKVKYVGKTDRSEVKKYKFKIRLYIIIGILAIYAIQKIASLITK